MKNVKMLSFFTFSNPVNRTRETTKSATKGTPFLAFFSLLVLGSAVSSHAQSVDTRELPWSSDSSYEAVQIQSSCLASDAKHAVWQTDVRNTTDSAIQLKALGKTAQVAANSTVEIGSVSAKNCKKPLRIKLDVRVAGDRGHYALDFNNGVVKAHYKTPTDWMGMTAAIMAGVSAGMGNPVAIPDLTAVDPGDGSDDSQ
jgi:hypothetical protein